MSPQYIVHMLSLLLSIKKIEIFCLNIGSKRFVEVIIGKKRLHCSTGVFPSKLEYSVGLH